MATAKKNETPAATTLMPEEARARAEEYTNGVDISLYELADRFEADGYDWRQALRDCGYSDDQVNEEVEKVTTRTPVEPEPEPEPKPEPQG